MNLLLLAILLGGLLSAAPLPQKQAPELSDFAPPSLAPEVSPADAWRGLRKLVAHEEVPASEMDRARSWVLVAAESGDPAFRDLLARVVRMTDPGIVAGADSQGLLLNLLCLDALYRIGGSDAHFRRWIDAVRESPYVAGNALLVLGRSPDPALLQQAQDLRLELEEESIQPGVTRASNAWRIWVLQSLFFVQQAAHLDARYGDTAVPRARIGLLLLHGGRPAYSDRDRLEPGRVLAHELLEDLSRQDEPTFIAEYLAVGIDDLAPFAPSLEGGSPRAAAARLQAIKLACLTSVSPAARAELEPTLRAVDPRRAK